MHALPAQDNGLVPIVEPEVTLGPGSYSIEENAWWSERVYSHVFRLLNEYGVNLQAILLKPNMCLPGQRAQSMTHLLWRLPMRWAAANAEAPISSYTLKEAVSRQQDCPACGCSAPHHCWC